MWSVRDAAAAASGQIYAAFPDKCADEWESSVELWFAHLSENTFTVRFNIAKSIAVVFDRVSDLRD